MSVLLTGARGFIGSWLYRYLIGLGADVHVLDLDICDYTAVRQFVRGKAISAVVHLAGVSSVRKCEEDVPRAIRVNTEASLMLAKIVSEESSGAHFVFVSTAQVYAPQKASKLSLDETSAVGPSNMYSLSKYMAEVALESIVSSGKISVTTLRLFNHTHKTQGDLFFLPSVYRQILEAKRSGDRVADIVVGNVDLVRDFGAIQDLIQILGKVVLSHPIKLHGYSLFNIAGGYGCSLRQLIEELGRHEGLEVRCIVDSKRVRSQEPECLVGNIDKVSASYSWTPKMSGSARSLIQAFLQDERFLKSSENESI